jgi:ketosteroid isomerase-like protein
MKREQDLSRYSPAVVRKHIDGTWKLAIDNPYGHCAA